jgi:formylglycine-generating enzyme required for sulfatase activity
LSVSKIRANAFGLHDLHGNAWEWVQDVWRDDHVGAPKDAAAWMVAGDQSRRVRRGGSFFFQPSHMRSARRIPRSPSHGGFDPGFRVARTLPP